MKIKKSIDRILKKILYFSFSGKFYHWTTRRGMIKHFMEEVETSKTLEKWVVLRIMEGQAHRRKELEELRKKVTESEALIDFLKNL